MAPLRVAHLGGGIFAREAHPTGFKPLIKEGLVEVVACWSRSEDSARSLAEVYDFKPEVVFGDEAVETLLKRDDIDAVTVVLPIFLAAQYSKKALDAGKHVLSEKPISGNIEDSRKAVEGYRSAKSNCIYAIAENYRFEKGLLYAAEEVKKYCGDIVCTDLMAHVHFFQGNKYEQTSWRQESKHVGGVLLDSAVHYAAGLRVVVGSPVKSVTSINTKRSKHLPQVDTVSALVEYDAGYQGTFTATYAGSTKGMVLTVIGSSASVIVERVYDEEKEEAMYRVTTDHGVDKDPVSKQFPLSGVPDEIRAWVNACLEPEKHPDTIKLLSPELAFDDVSMVVTMVESKPNLVEIPRV